jgi:predicted MFS family arabinose efflux permease
MDQRSHDLPMAASSETTRPHAALPVALGGLIAMATGVGIGRFVYTPILPPMIEALGLSKSEAGLIASSNFLGYLLGALLAATPWLAGPRRRWLLGGLAASTLTTLGMGLTTSLAAFLVLRFAGGMASALVLILASALVLERLAEVGRPGLAAVHFAGVGSGIAVSALAVALLAAAGQSWQSLWLASGALSLVASIAVVLLIPDRPAPARPTGKRPHPAAGGSLPRLIGAYGLFGFGYVITATFLVTVVRATPDIRPLEPVIWTVFGLSAAPSVAVWTRIAGRVGIPTSFAAACLVEAAGVLASVVWPSTAGVFLAAILVGGTFMGLTALGLVRARGLATGDPHRVLALMTGAFGVGQIVGPAFAGMLYDRLGSLTVPSFTAAGALVLAAVLVRR